MPSGKKARQQRQAAAAAPPPVRSKGGPGGKRQASTRTLAIAGGVILVVIVAVVLAIVISQSHSSGSNTSSSYDGTTIGIVPGTPAVGNSSTTALLSAPKVAKDFNGVPQTRLVLGNANAPVTLVEYVDVQCPFCAEFETTALPPLIEKYVRTGKVKVQLHVWNIIDANDGGDDSLRGQKVVNGAAAQNLAFDYISLLYWNQGTEGTGWLNNGMVSQIAAGVDGLKTAQLETDSNSSATQAVIDATDAYGRSRSDFTGTPVILLAKGDGKPVLYGTGWGQAPMDLPSLEAKIDSLLK
jgi:protein-disulfide isomerase